MKKIATILAASALLAALAQGCEASKHEDPADATAGDGATGDSGAADAAAAKDESNTMGGMDM